MTPPHDPRAEPPERKMKAFGITIPPPKPKIEEKTEVERGGMVFGIRTEALLKAAKDWSPGGVAISFGAVFLLVFRLIGGLDGAERVAKALGSSIGASNKMIAMQEQIIRDLKIERAERQRIQAVALCERERSVKLCHFVSEINMGRPHPEWCGEPGTGLTWTRSPNGSAPILRTAATWPNCDVVAANISIPNQ
jgi:hypothetical protein